MLRTISLRYSDGHASPKEAAKCFLLYPAGNARYRLFEFTAVYFSHGAKGLLLQYLQWMTCFVLLSIIKVRTFN